MSYPKARFAFQPDAVHARFNEAHSTSTPARLRHTLTFQEYFRHQISSYACSLDQSLHKTLCRLDDCNRATSSNIWSLQQGRNKSKSCLWVSFKRSPCLHCPCDLHTGTLDWGLALTSRIDGGGIRGVSALLILEAIMENLREIYGLRRLPGPVNTSISLAERVLAGQLTLWL